MEKVHHQIRLRILSCAKVSENHRGPEVPEVKAPVVECHDGLVRITLEELAITHSVKKWHPPECLYYKTKSGCRFGEKCAFAHRQVDEQPTKRSKTNNDKSAVDLLKKGNWQERESVTDECHDRPGKPGKRGDKKLGQNSSKRQFSDARQMGCVFQDMTPPKSILRKSTDMPKPIQRVKFTKAVARHTKIRDQKSPRSVTFVQVHLISAAPTLQNLRIGLRRRQSGKSKVPAKQRGSWPKMC